MIDAIELGPRDRVLLLSLARLPWIAELAAKVSSGIVVGIGSADEVAAARKAARDVENVMFIPAEPDEIPWQEQFFTRVIDTRCDWPRPERVAREVARLLTPGGTAYILESAREAVLAAGLSEQRLSGTFLVAAKPA